jgi:hypothetical protein
MPRYAVPIPDVIPEDTICLPVSIPNDPAYVAMLVDAIARLTHSRNYQRDANKTGKIIGQLWTEKTLSPLLNTITSLQTCGESAMTCEEIEDCIEVSPTIIDITQRLTNVTDNSTTVIHDMRTWNYHQNTTINNPISSPVANTPEIPDLCQQSLWSGCLSIVQMLHNQNMDFLEKTSLLTGNNIRKFTGIVDMIPAIGAVADEIVIADLIDFIALMATTMYTNYEAIVTDDLLYQTACNYYSMTCADCSVPTYKQILDYHAGFISGLDLQNTANAIIDIIGLYLIGSFSGDMWFHAVTWFQLWVLAGEETFLGKRGTEWISLAYRLGANNPDADYLIWCDPCEVPGSCPETCTQVKIITAGITTANKSAEITLYGTRGNVLASQYQECASGSGWIYTPSEPQCFTRCTYLIADYSPVTSHIVRIYVDDVIVYEQNVHPISNSGTTLNAVFTPTYGESLRFEIQINSSYALYRFMDIYVCQQ